MKKGSKRDTREDYYAYLGRYEYWKRVMGKLFSQYLELLSEEKPSRMELQKLADKIIGKLSTFRFYLPLMPYDGWDNHRIEDNERPPHFRMPI